MKTACQVWHIVIYPPGKRRDDERKWECSAWCGLIASSRRAELEDGGPLHWTLGHRLEDARWQTSKCC